MLRKIKKRAAKLFRPSASQFVQFGEVKLPAKRLRYCGMEFKDDEYFFNSCLAEANKLVEHFGLGSNTSILDVGCGVGRLAIGILHSIENIKSYFGIDINKESIEWCKKYISSKNPNFQFQQLNVYNSRYNPEGYVLDENFRFPFSDKTFNIIYLYSVFSHMTVEDMKIYLKEFQRIINPSGKIFLTAFVEEGVEPVTVNPENYKHAWTGDLHCVLYDKKYIEDFFQDAGFKVDRFNYETETNDQSGYHLSVRDAM